MEFMARAAKQTKGFRVRGGDIVPHHPRWENQWRTVTVYLSTWDLNYRISELDVQLAARLDRVASDVMRSRSGAAE